MKISYRILLINFAVVVAILASSAVAIYSVMYNVVTSEQSRYLVNSANNFLYNYRIFIEEGEEEFIYLKNENFSNLKKIHNLDVILVSDGDSSDNYQILFSSSNAVLPTHLTINEFLNANPHAVLKSFNNNNQTFYFGRLFDKGVLNTFSNRIGSDIALLWDNSVADISNPPLNEKYFKTINQVQADLSKDNNFKVYEGTEDTDDIIATKYNPAANSELITRAEFIIFSKFGDKSVFISEFTQVLILVGLTGVILSLILTMIFTDKIRKQITGLNNATDVIKKGDFSKKIIVQSTDELGQLGSAFNTMLDVLAHNEQIKSEYSEFMTLINQNPTLSEISDAALSNIIKTCGYTVGALYLVDENQYERIASHGVDNNFHINSNPTLFNKVIKNGEMLEVHIKEDLPQLVSGFVSIHFSHLLIVPVIYNNKVIAIIELGSVTEPSESAKEYISRIQEQLAIGLTNSIAFVQMENLVRELKNLNEEYQKQNFKVMKQNEILLELHKELNDKAEELAQQKEKAEESTKLKSQFLASMSHELRTPMNSILGLTELILEESSLSGKNRERLEVVLKSSKRLMNLINGILDLSKIEAGKIEIFEEEVLLEEIISEVETSASPLVVPKNLEFRIERNIETNVFIKTDRGKLMQILINLVGNAIKFTESGYVELSVSSPEEELLQFDIKDTGIGISEKDQEIIFQEFRQADGSTTRKYDGTGLGLAICSRLCTIMDASISMASKLNEGSTFTVILPVKKSTSASQLSNLPYNIEVLVKNRQNPVLVIDDDADVRNTIGQYLNSRGYDVEFAENGYKGVSEAVRLQPFAITLDLMLPNNEGWTTLKELKDNPLTRDIPVILVSILGDKKVGYGLGAFEYFVKPISQNEFLSAINKLENLANKRIEKIVIVDDDELEFEKFRHEFGNENIRINYIKDSQIAFSKILEIQPDLVIIDLLMPVVDGITLSHKLKMNKETRHIPIIISTAKDLSDNEKNSLKNIVENITVKSKGHPLDVLKVVRDRIKMQEIHSNNLIDLEKSIREENNPAPSTNNQSQPSALEIIIVDDDPDSLYTIDEIVQSCDCKTILARSGKECLEILKEKTPDLILLDIMMPEMDGFQVLKHIRANPDWENIPVYAVTAKAMLDDKAVIIKYGFEDYIFKPVNSGMLAFKLKKLLYKLRVNNEKNISN